MSSSGAGLGLGPTRRVTRSASREASRQQATPLSSSAPSRRKSRPIAESPPAPSDSDLSPSPSSPSSPSSPPSALNPLERVQRELSAEPPVERARRVYEYINRANYQEAEAAVAEEKELEARERAEEERSKQRSFASALTDATNRSSLYTLLLVSTLMLVVPISAFYLASALLFASFSPNQRLAYSGFVAVVAVNVVSLGFGVYAYYEAEEPETEAEKNEREDKSRAVQDEWVRQVTHGAMTGVGQWNEELKQQMQQQSNAADPQ